MAYPTEDVESMAFEVISDPPVVLCEDIIPEEGIAKIWSASLKEANRSANCCG